MEISDKEIIFQTMSHSDIEKTAVCISQVFSSSEPLALALNHSFNDIYLMAIQACQKAADEQVSTIAKDQKTGEVVGFIICEGLMTTNPPPPKGIDEKFEALFSLFAEMEDNYRSRHSIQTGQVLHIFMLGVQETYRKRYIAKNLVIETLKLAKCNKFETAIVEATAVSSQHLFRTLGFTEECAIAYKSYKFKDEHIFSSIDNPPHCLLMSSPI